MPLVFEIDLMDKLLENPEFGTTAFCRPFVNMITACREAVKRLKTSRCSGCAKRGIMNRKQLLYRNLVMRYTNLYRLGDKDTLRCLNKLLGEDTVIVINRRQERMSV